MKTVLLAAHGYLAQGMKSALEMIVGDVSNVIFINAFTDSCPNPKQTITDLLKQYTDDELLVLTDVCFGGVNQLFMQLRGERKFPLITGISLPLTVELITAARNCLSEQSLNAAISLCRREMKLVEAIKNNNADDETEEL